MNRHRQRGVPRGRDRQRGQTLAMIPAVLIALLAMSALVIDLGNLYACYQELQVATQAAAIAGAALLNTGTAQQAENQATTFSAAAAADYNSHPNLINVTMVPGYPQVKCLASTGVVCYASSGANAIIVQEQATVKTFFAGLFGVHSLTISATATASAKGGISGPYNVMMVLDTTRSMGSTTDPGCTVPGVGGSPTPEQCAQYGVQQLLGNLYPCTPGATCTSVTSSNAVDEVGLMVFPGLCSDTALGVTTSHCPNASTLTDTTANSTYAPPDYACPSVAPPIAAYNNDPEYLIVPLQYNYRESDTSTTLNWNGSIVDAVGAGVGALGYSSCTGVGTPGGEGTFYAGAIKAAQDYLVANSRPNVTNVMVLLSDGDANADSSQMAGSVTSYSTRAECQQAVDAANTAKGAPYNILIYSVSYGSENSGCTTGDSLTPCTTMQGIASSPSTTYFFSVPKGSGGGTVCSGARPDTTLNQVFTDIAGDLTAARLIPNGTT